MNRVLFRLMSNKLEVCSLASVSVRLTNNDLVSKLKRTFGFGKDGNLLNIIHDPTSYTDKVFDISFGTSSFNTMPTSYPASYAVI